MHVELRLGGLISVNGREIALGKTAALLDGIARERSVRGAADQLSVSYRSAWARVAELEDAVGRPLVVKTKGHGTVLTELGEEVRRALQDTLSRYEEPLRGEQRALERRLAALIGAQPRRARVAASHDPLLVEVLGARPDLELAILGTEAALDRLRAGAAEMAGCHFGPERGDLPGWLRDPVYAAEPAFQREQGLILASGNPLAIASIDDVARTRARFINRQKGSGTRAWLERLLAERSIAPEAIVGFGAEEFTHQAVAAVVASGAADAGFGVRAVAEAFGLGFVPLGWETYHLVRRADWGSPAFGEIAAELQARSRERAGYRAALDPGREPA